MDRAKQLIVVVIIVLRFVECLADMASEWAGHYELALFFKAGSWVPPHRPTAD